MKEKKWGVMIEIGYRGRSEGTFHISVVGRSGSECSDMNYETAIEVSIEVIVMRRLWPVDVVFPALVI